MNYAIQVGIFFTVVFLVFLFRRRRKRLTPKAPTDLKLKFTDIRGANMATVNVTARWVKSVSTDVVSQELVVYVNDEIHDVLQLDKDVEVAVLEDIEERSELKVELFAFDGAFKSSPAVATLSIPDLVAPEAPTNLVLELPSTPPVAVEDDE